MPESQEIINSLEQIEKSLRGVEGLTREYSATLTKATSEMLNKNKMLATGVKKTSDAYKESEARVKALVQQMASLKAQFKEVYDAQQKLEKSAERMAKGYAAWAESTEKVYGTLKGAIGTFSQYTTILGVQSLGVKTLTDRYLKYNQALFNLSRVQQVAGRGTKDLQQAFGIVREKTTLARDQFASMASEISNVNVGLAPTSKSIANVAAIMKDRFGPATDVIIAKTKEFFQIQSEWPDLAKEIQAAQAAIAIGNDKEAESHKSLALSMARQSNMGAQAMKSISQMADKSTKEQQDRLKLNETIGKTSQKWGDMQLDVAEKMAPTLEKLAVAAGKLADALDRIPGYLAAISGGMETAGLIGGVGGMALLAKGLTKISARGLSRGAMSAAGGAGTGISTDLAAGGASTLMSRAPDFVPGKGLRAAGAATRGIGLTGALRTGASIAGAGALALGAGYAAGTLIDKKMGWSDTLGKTFGAANTPLDVDEFKDTGATKRRKRMAQEPQKIDKEIKNANIDYLETLQNQQKWIENIGKAASAMSELTSLGEKMGVANADAAKAQRDQFVFAKGFAEEAAKSTLSLVKENTAAQNVALNIEDGKDSSEKLRSVQKQINDALVQSKGDTEKIKALTIAQRDVSEQLLKIRQQESGVIDSMVAQMTTQLNVNNSLNDIYENRLGVERQLLETSMFGLGASVEMMQKQVDLMQRRVESNKEGLAAAEQALNADKKLSDQQIERLQNAQSDLELRNAALDISNATGKSQEELIAYAKQYQTVVTDSMKQQQKILEITKQVREGYLSAMKQAAFGFGQFGKIIGLQQRGASQLMNLVKKVTGSRQLNTFAMGGQQSQADTQAGLGKDVSYQYSTTGVQKNISREEESRRLNRTWKYKETARMAAGGARVGTGVAASPADIAVMQQRAAGRSGGGENVKTSKGLPDLTKGTMAVEKGSVYTPGATLPGQQGIPPNYAGGENIVPFAIDVTKRSRGQVANPSGGPALTPTPLKGATKEAHVSEWMKPMFEKQDATNAKLDDILVELKSGMNIRSMNITA